MTEERNCIFCWESDEPETLQPLSPGPGALSDVEPTAWVHKCCLETYSRPPGDHTIMPAQARIVDEGNLQYLMDVQLASLNEQDQIA
jgi:hypothetical protein